MLKQEPSKDSSIRGSIVHVANHNVRSTSRNPATLVAAQEGLVGLTKSDAFDYGPDLIRVNCVSTGLISESNLTGVFSGLKLEETTLRAPLRRAGTSQDVANAIVWLSSPLASWITGTVVPVDGGFYLNST